MEVQADFPRLALLLFCAAYVLPGLFGRDPWRNADLTAQQVPAQPAPLIIESRLMLQRRSATTAQIASTSPNGQAPCKNP